MFVFPGLTGLFVHKPASFLFAQISFLIALESSFMTAKFRGWRILRAGLDAQRDDYTSVPVRREHLTRVSTVQSRGAAAGLLAPG